MRLAGVILAVIMTAVPAAAQETGILTGRIASESGVSLFGANVVVKSPAIEGLRGSTSDSRGMYRVEGLPAGVHEGTVTFLGYV